jgi:hypothetical protein
VDRLDEDEPEPLLPDDTTALPSPTSDEDPLLTEAEEEAATTDPTTLSLTTPDTLPVSNELLALSSAWSLFDEQEG